MKYQIVKGWPSAGALDEVVTQKTGEAVEPGLIVQQAAADNGAVSIAVSPAEGSGVPTYFVIDGDEIKSDQFTALTGEFIVEVEEDQLSGADATAFTTGDKVASDAAGKFVVATTEEPVGTVVGPNGVAGGKVRIRWDA